MSLIKYTQNVIRKTAHFLELCLKKPFKQFKYYSILPNELKQFKPISNDFEFQHK